MRVYIYRLAAAMLALTPAGMSSSVTAQDFQYDCQNESVRISIPGGHLVNSLEKLRAVTRCPISGTRLAKGKRSRPVTGNMVPEQALRAMLRGTGLKEKQIRGGFQIVRKRG